MGIESSKQENKEDRDVTNSVKMNPFHLGEVLEVVFRHLTLSDLANLRLTCHEGKEAVDGFAMTYLSARQREEALRHFYNSSRLCLLPHERKLFEASHANGSNCFLRFRMAQEIVKDGTARFLVARADVFHHLDNPNYIRTERDDQLQREVVHLISVCWLLFRIHLGYHTRGNYTLRMRFKNQGRDFSSDGDAPGELSVVRVLTDSVVKIITEEIGFPAWKKMARGGFDQSALRFSTLAQGSDGWMYLVMRFTLSVDSELMFEFSDTKNGWWKSNMYWDFVEIQKYSS